MDDHSTDLSLHRAFPRTLIPVMAGVTILLAMCVVTLLTPAIGFGLGLMGFQWESVESFAYGWWPSCLFGGWTVARVVGGTLIVLGIVRYMSSRTRSKPDNAETQMRVQQLWEEFTDHLGLMFVAVEQITKIEVPKPLEPGASILLRENTRRCAELLENGRNSLEAAETRLQELQYFWPRQRRALRTLISALTEYKNWLEAYDRLNRGMDPDLISLVPF